MRDEGKRNVLGVLVDVVDYDGAVSRVVAAAHRVEPLTVTALAVHGVMTGVLDRQHRQRLNHFGLITPDGQPVRWALNLLHRVALRQRVYGPELMLRVCERAEVEGLAIYLYGSTPEMLGNLATLLVAQFPLLKIAGTRCSFFRPMSEEECENVVQAVQASGARIVFVGLGCPRQEVFVHEMGPRFALPTLAVGAAFAFHSGASTMAPQWMQNRGLEWLYRLWHEPRRLWQRYLLLNPLYLALVAGQRLRLIRFATTNSRVPKAEPLWG